jgi:UDPglucose 6-dehydrogenase
MYLQSDSLFPAFSIQPQEPPFLDAEPLLRLQSPAQHALNALRQFYGQSLANLNIAVWGLSLDFCGKQQNASSLHNLLTALMAEGMTVRLHDPLAGRCATNYQCYGPALTIYENRDAALTQTDALIVWNPSQSFRAFNVGLARQHMRRLLVIDMCQMYSGSALQKHGVHYLVQSA